MNIGHYITTFSIRRYKLLTSFIVLLTLAVLLAAAIPSLVMIKSLPQPVRDFSAKFGFLPKVAVDTDPENMLDDDEAVRVFNHEMKKRLNLNDIIVVGVVNETNPAGVFNPESLAKIYELTEFAKTLQFDEDRQLITSANNAAANGQDQTPPATNSDEPPALDALFAEPAPIDGLDGSLPTGPIDNAPPAFADDAPKTEGVIAADIIAPSTVDAIEPKSGAIVFQWLMDSPPANQAEADEILRKARRVPFLNGTLVSDDGKALALYLPITRKDLSYNIYKLLQEKIDTLGSGDEQFYITGLPVAEDTFGVEMFIQMAISAPAAMVLIFLLMLAFFRKLIVVVSPMIVAMVSVIITMGALILADLPIHIMSSMIPIFIMPIAVLDSIHIISEFFEKYQSTRDSAKTITDVMDELFGPMLYTSLTSAAGFASLALTPIPPVQVFGIFVAAGILVAWVLTITFIPAFVMFIPAKRLENFGSRHHDDESNTGLIGKMLKYMGGFTYRRAKLIVAVSIVVMCVALYGISLININDNPVKWFDENHPIRVADKVLNDHFGGTYMAYLAMEAADDAEGEIFKNPEVLNWQSELQKAMLATGVVGKSNSLSDIVKTVHRDLMAESVSDPDIENLYRIPDSPQAVANMITQFESSHRPADLQKFAVVAGDNAYRTASLWVQLTSGDNQDMQKVVDSVEKFVSENPPPVALELNWFGLTYINVVWQDKMVVGMLEAFAGSFIIVLLLMTILFRSALWGLLSMIPLTVTIAGIYGAIGILGKDYDMPVAVLSSLTLGMAVDFAIHLLARARQMHAQSGSWQATAPLIFAEPARAITRNIIVIAAGFLPLLAAPLVPYQTVGILLATILLTSGAATLLILPAMIKLLEKRLFRFEGSETDKLKHSCNCGLCLIVSATLAAIIALYFYSTTGWSKLTWISVVAIPVMALLCSGMSRRRSCRREN